MPPTEPPRSCQTQRLARAAATLMNLRQIVLCKRSTGLWTQITEGRIRLKTSGWASRSRAFKAWTPFSSANRNS